MAARPGDPWRQRLGRAAEDLAARHLRSRGCKVLARRYRWRGGEIDLIVRDGRVVAFVEVKARRGRRYGSGAEALTEHKRRRLRATAGHFLSHSDVGPSPCRFDLVSVELSDGRATVRWIRDAFRP